MRAEFQIEPVIVGSSAWMISSPLVTLPTAIKSSGATGAVKTPATAWIAIANVVILVLWFQAHVLTPYRPPRYHNDYPGRRQTRTLRTAFRPLSARPWRFFPRY